MNGGVCQIDLRKSPGRGLPNEYRKVMGGKKKKKLRVRCDEGGKRQRRGY